MNDNYLWDKSGEPDDEIQLLESLLSDFRYQPRPLVLPETTPKRSIFNSVPFVTLRFGALAALALLTLSAGLWFAFRQQAGQPEIAGRSVAATPSAAPSPEPTPELKRQNEAPSAQSIKYAAPAQRRVRSTKAPIRIKNEHLEKEGEKAKEKVLYALQITSQQLDALAKKIQTDTN